MNRYCFSHSADYDGIFSAEIAKKYYNNNIQIIPITYSDKEVLTIFDKYNLADSDVIICDFSFSDEIMKKLTTICKSVIWCDHHKTAIERIKAQSYYSKLSGCQSVNYSGAELIWAQLYNNGNVFDMSNEPDIIKWIGIYDTWRFKDNTEKEEMLYIQNGLKAYGITFNSLEFQILLNPAHSKYKELIDYIISIGKAKRQYQINFQFHLYENLARTIKFNIHGKVYKACAMNTNGYSEMFMYAYDKHIHDFCIRYAQNIEGKWGYSIYVMPDKIGIIDATEIAAYISPNNSGGHTGCAGASTNVLVSELA